MKCLHRIVAALLCWAAVFAVATAAETESQALERLAPAYDAARGVVCPDGTVCDLLGDELAIDAAPVADWSAAVGRSLLVAAWTNRAPGVLLLRHAADDLVPLLRARVACARAEIALFVEELRMASVVGRHVYYPGSSFGSAIATDKAALLPGETAAFANYISRGSSGGVAMFRGIYVDILDLAAPESITASDFEFTYGNDDDPSGWASATAPSSVSVSEGAGVDGSDRIDIQWATSAMPNSNWLRVRVKPNANTGLAAEDIHYWGVAVGEVGNDGANAEVTSADSNLIAANVDAVNPVAITSPYDINRDTFVLFGDAGICVTSYTSEAGGDALLLITPFESMAWVAPVSQPLQLVAGYAGRIADTRFQPPEPLTGAELFLWPPTIDGARADAIRVKQASLEVKHLAAVRTIPGVVILAVAGRNGPGVGRLASSADGTTIAWQAPDSATFGPAVDVSTNGVYLLEDGADASKWIRVRVYADHLSPTPRSSRVHLADLYANGPPHDDVTAAEAAAGDVTDYTLNLVNEGAKHASDLRVWLDAATSDLEISDDAISWVNPTSESAGLGLGSLSSGESVTLWLRRTIGAAANSDPEILTKIHYAFSSL